MVQRGLPELLRRLLWVSRVAPKPPDIPGLFTDYRKGQPTGIADITLWNDTYIRKNPITWQCLVTKVRWYKGWTSLQHEFLGFDISSPDKVHTAILIAERLAGDITKGKDAYPTDPAIGPGIPSVTIPPLFASQDVASDSIVSSADETSPNIARGKSTATDTRKKLKVEGLFKKASSSSNSISRRLANDEIIHATLDSIASAPLEQKCKDSDCISTLTFPEDAGLSANKIATLLVVTLALEPTCQLMNTQCYWFVATVFEASKRLFLRAKQDVTEHNRGTWYQVRIPKKSSVDAVCAKYKAARSLLDVEIEEERRVEQDREEARRREIEDHRAAAERAHEQRQAAEERTRIAEEETKRERQATEERDRAAAEEIAKLQRQLEASRAGKST